MKKKHFLQFSFSTKHFLQNHYNLKNLRLVAMDCWTCVNMPPLLGTGFQIFFSIQYHSFQNYYLAVITIVVRKSFSVQICALSQVMDAQRSARHIFFFETVCFQQKKNFIHGFPLQLQCIKVLQIIVMQWTCADMCPLLGTGLL